jgi:hypothetical protein
MNVLRLLLAPGLLASALLVAPASAQLPMVFRGVVVDDSARVPLASAEVTIDGRIARTDSAGRFRFQGVPPGEADIRVRRIGYRELARSLVIPSDSAEVVIGISRSAQLLSGVEVSGSSPLTAPGMRAFEERRALGIGHFVTREQLAKVEHRRMVDVMRTVPGIRIVTGPGNKFFVATSRGSGSIESRGAGGPARSRPPPVACLASVYLDGAPLYRGVSTEPFNINDLNTMNIEALEYYAGPSQIPAQYNATGGTCAVLLLWTRVK